MASLVADRKVTARPDIPLEAVSLVFITIVVLVGTATPASRLPSSPLAQTDLIPSREGPPHLRLEAGERPSPGQWPSCGAWAVPGFRG